MDTLTSQTPSIFRPPRGSAPRFCPSSEPARTGIIVAMQTSNAVNRQIVLKPFAFMALLLWIRTVPETGGGLIPAATPHWRLVVSTDWRVVLQVRYSHREPFRQTVTFRRDMPPLS